MGPIGLPGGMSVPESNDKPSRCFITKIEVEKPEWNRFVSRVYFKADHALGDGFEGSFSTANGQDYKVGDVITITMHVGDL